MFIYELVMMLTIGDLFYIESKNKYSYFHLKVSFILRYYSIDVKLMLWK